MTESSQVRGRHAAVDRQGRTGRAAGAWSGQEADGLGDVLGENVDLQHGALPVILVEFFWLNAVGGCARQAPARVPDTAVLEYGVGQHRVHAYPDRASFFRQ